MKCKLFLAPLAVLSLSVFYAPSAHSQTVITFDDISGPGTISSITNGYQKLSWANFYCLNAVLDESINGLSGGYYGMVSPPNVAFNGDGYPAEIDSPGTSFNFFSTYLTGAWNSNLNIQVEGFRGGSLVYNLTVIAAATNATLFTFNYTDIDRLYFDSFGGQDAGFGSGAGEEFVMDNFTFEFIPEPSTFLLAALGGVSLIAFLRRQRS
ncbi:MAG: PEP-CTERM sorting domain-containing protein [Verrucomicrobiia bacterium]|jgi:hypothetical protein